MNSRRISQYALFLVMHPNGMYLPAIAYSDDYGEDLQRVAQFVERLSVHEG